MTTDTGAELLTEAIISQAMKDYINLLTGSIEEPTNNIHECEDFFGSDWCRILLGGNVIDAETIKKIGKRRADYQIFKKVHKCGKCKRIMCPQKHDEKWETVKGKWVCLKDDDIKRKV